MFGKKLRTLFGALVALFAIGLVLTPAISAQGMEVVVFPTDTPGGFEASIADFPHDKSFSVTATGPGQAIVGLNPVRTNGDGAVTFGFHLPRYVPAGQWTLQVTAKDGDASATATFDMPNLGPNGELAIAAAGDGSYGFSSTSFQDDEAVHYWLTGPDGQIYAADSIAADERVPGKSEKRDEDRDHRHGLIEFSVAVSPDMPRGQYAVSAYGMKSDILAIATFTVN